MWHNYPIAMILTSASRSKRTLTTALHFVPETDVHADIAAVKATKFAKQDLLKAT